MTDRIHSFTVVLDHDIREDDAQAIANAILQLRGVIEVKGNVTDPGQLVAESRARQLIGEKLIKLVDETFR
ncbi:hypothetical protein ACYPKM_05070 [Pseudomonas aeruginosa]